jgi:hypothetical protein
MLQQELKRNKEEWVPLRPKQMNQRVEFGIQTDIEKDLQILE